MNLNEPSNERMKKIFKGIMPLTAKKTWQIWLFFFEFVNTRLWLRLREEEKIIAILVIGRPRPRPGLLSHVKTLPHVAHGRENSDMFLCLMFHEYSLSTILRTFQYFTSSLSPRHKHNVNFYQDCCTDQIKLRLTLSFGVIGLDQFNKCICVPLTPLRL